MLPERVKECPLPRSTSRLMSALGSREGELAPVRKAGLLIARPLGGELRELLGAGCADMAGFVTDGSGVPTGTPLTDPPLVELLSEDPVLRNTKLIAEAWDCDGLNQVPAPSSSALTAACQLRSHVSSLRVHICPMVCGLLVQRPLWLASSQWLFCLARSFLPGVVHIPFQRLRSFVIWWSARMCCTCWACGKEGHTGLPARQAC